MNYMNHPKTLTQKEAYQYLNIGIDQFKSEVKRGNIEFLTAGKRKKFTIEALEAWRNNTHKHIDYINEENTSTHTSRLSQITEKDIALEKLREKWNALKLKNTASKGYMKSIKRRTVN